MAGAQIYTKEFVENLIREQNKKMAEYHKFVKQVINENEKLVRHNKQLKEKNKQLVKLAREEINIMEDNDSEDESDEEHIEIDILEYNGREYNVDISTWFIWSDDGEQIGIWSDELGKPIQLGC